MQPGLAAWLPRWLRTSLRRKILVAVIAVDLVMVVLLIGNTLRLFNDVIEEEARQRVSELSPVLNAALAPGLFRRDFAGTQDTLDDLLRGASGSIAYLAVLDDRARVFASAGPVPPGNLPAESVGTTLRDSTLHRALPLAIGAERVGELRFGLSQASLLEARRSVLWQGLAIAVLGVCLAVAALALVALWLTRDLEQLVVTTRAMAQGDYSVQAVAHGDDEIARLAQDFNVMSAAVRARNEELEAREQQIRTINAGLEARVLDRTTELQTANKELEAFSYSVSHDLRAPLRAVDGFARMLVEDYGDRLDATAQDYLSRVRGGTQRMAALIDGLLELSRVGRVELWPASVDLGAMASEILAQFAAAEPGRKVTVSIEPALTAHGDARLLQIALTNLLDNAWKYTGRIPHAFIEVGQERIDGRRAFFVRDNGAGFEMQYAAKLFGAFERLHGAEFGGTGIGLATVQRIIVRHGGRVWAHAEPGKGATFHFTLADPAERAVSTGSR